MSMCKLIPSLLVATIAVGMTAPRAEAQLNLNSGLIINDVALTGVDYANGVLTAAGGTVTGTLGGLPFTTGINNLKLQLAPPDAPDAGGCSVLHLELAPIALNLLGLHVNTGRICLDVTAFEDEGILGSLLCSLAGGDLSLLGGLGDALSGVPLAALTDANPTTPAPAEDICDGDCEVLDLSLGPVNLALLGLHVDLDNCADGPVQVCVSATASEGLLGGLLCGLAGNGGILGNLDVLNDLLGTVLDALGGQTPTAKQAKQLANRLSGQVADRLVDGALSDADLAKVTKTIRQALR